MAQTTVNGARLAYDDIGAHRGPVIVLLHGFPFSRRMWRAQQQTIEAAGYRGILPDLRGHGESEVTLGPYTMDLFADDVLALLDHLGVERFALGGFSMGGYTAFALWRKAAARVRALLLVDTQHKADSAEARANRYKGIETIRDQGVSVFVDNLAPRLVGETTRRERPAVMAEVKTIMAATTGEAIMAALAGLAERPDSTATLATIDAPTWIVVGEEDGVTPPAVHREMQGQIAHSLLMEIPQAGHMSPMERPDVFNRHLAQFLEAVKPS